MRSEELILSGTTNVCPNYSEMIINKGSDKYLEKAKLVDRELNERLDKLNDSEREKLSDCSNIPSFNAVRNLSIRTDSIEKRRLLEDVLIHKIKYSSSEEQGLIYDKAILAVAELTPNEILLLVFIETYSIILYSIIIEKGMFNGNGATELYTILATNLIFKLEEIKKCEKMFLLYDENLHEYDLEALYKYKSSNTEIQRLTDIVKDILIRHSGYSLDKGVISGSNNTKLSVYCLSEIGKKIASVKIKSLGIEYIANDICPLKLSDLIANNVLAMGSSSAKNRMTSSNGFYEERDEQ